MTELQPRPRALEDLARALSGQVSADCALTPGTRVIGIAGGPGSGKSTLAGLLREAVAARQPELEPAVIPMDGFHLRQAELEELGMAGRKGAPETFDPLALASLLDVVRAPHSAPIPVPDYDRTVHEPVEGRLTVPAGSRVVIVEGNWLALDLVAWRQVRARLDALWFLDVPWSVSRDRLVARRVATGRDEASARVWVDSVDAEHYWLAHDSSRHADKILTPGVD